MHLSIYKKGLPINVFRLVGSVPTFISPLLRLLRLMTFLPGCISSPPSSSSPSPFPQGSARKGLRTRRVAEGPFSPCLQPTSLIYWKGPSSSSSLLLCAANADGLRWKTRSGEGPCQQPPPPPPNRRHAKEEKGVQQQLQKKIGPISRGEQASLKLLFFVPLSSSSCPWMLSMFDFFFFRADMI